VVNMVNYDIMYMQVSTWQLFFDMISNMRHCFELPIELLIFLHLYLWVFGMQVVQLKFLFWMCLFIIKITWWHWCTRSNLPLAIIPYNVMIINGGTKFCCTFLTSHLWMPLSFIVILWRHALRGHRSLRIWFGCSLFFNKCVKI